MDDFIKKQVSCPLCEKEFSTLTVRKSRQSVSKTDSDFCVYYERETPYFYSVYVCPGCGYAFLESFAKQPFAKMRDKLVPLPDFFSGKRDTATAQLAYNRVIECAKMQRESDTVLASLYLHLAWIHRLKEEVEKETTALADSLTYYTGVYESSDLEDASKVMYLIGELNRRLGKPKEAVFWYSRVANDKKSNQAMRHRAREAWQSLKE